MLSKLSRPFFLPSSKKLEKIGISNIRLFDLHALSFTQVYSFFSQAYLSLPEKIKSHREFFSTEGRGFGEDAFHAFWYWLFLNYFSSSTKHLNFLEIGVFRGQTLTLLSLLSRHFGVTCISHGLSPFNSSGDAVSNYPDLDYKIDILRSAAFFNVDHSIELFEAFSDQPSGLQKISSQEWDLIYIDGSHDESIVLSDFHASLNSLKSGGFLVFDDSSLRIRQISKFINFPGFLGHPGPSNVAFTASQHSNLIHILSVGHLNLFKKTL